MIRYDHCMEGVGDMESNEADINEQDFRAIETMVLSGLDLEALCAVFPSFDPEAIKRVYESVKGVTEAERVPVKVNCS